jgi:hypothetical protein
MVEKQGQGWSSPIHLDDPINTDAQEFYPTVTAKGTPYFSSTRPGGKGRGGDNGSGNVYRIPAGTFVEASSQ